MGELSQQGERMGQGPTLPKQGWIWTFPWHFQPRGKCPTKLFLILILHGRASNPGYIPVSTSKLSQLSGKSLISYCVSILPHQHFVITHSDALSFSTSHLFPSSLLKTTILTILPSNVIINVIIINCWKPAASTNWAKFTFSLHSFFLMQSFLTLTQLINRPGLKFSTQEWDFMENMHLNTLKFAWLPFSSVIQFRSCHQQTDIITPPFFLKGKQVVLSCSFTHFWVRPLHLVPVCLAPQTLHPSMWKTFSSLSPQLFSSPPYGDTLQKRMCIEAI